MASGIDYGKWKNIEISDDEEDVHPNIDTPSLFKWRHEARVQRMEEFEKKKQEAEQQKAQKERELSEMKRKAQHHLLEDVNIPSPLCVSSQPILQIIFLL